MNMLSFCCSYSLNLENAVGLTFVERLESVRYDTGEVNENLFAVLSRNESVAFFAIEPFYLTCHKN